MALAKTITKMWPDENRVGINLVITDNDRPDKGAGAQVVIHQTIFCQYVSGEDMTNKVRDEIGNEAQGLIDKYKALRAKYDKPAYQTKVTQINNNLTL